MKIGITGVTGNLGRRLLTYLTERLTEQDEIVCLIRNINAVPENSDSRITWIEGDINNKQALASLVKSLDVCIHLASLVGFASNAEYQHVNKIGTEALCSTIAQYNRNCRLIHCSSIAVLRRNNNKTWLNTDYANSKYDADCTVRHFANVFGLNVNIVYPGIIYGPGESNFIPTISRYLKKGVVFFIRGGEQHCPMIYIDDLCELFWRVTKTPETDQNFIGVGPQEFGIHQFIRNLAATLGVRQPRVTLPKWLLLPIAILMEKMYRLLNVTKAPLISKRSVDMLSINLSPELVREYNKDFWHPTVGMAEGMQASLEWCREKKLV